MKMMDVVVVGIVGRWRSGVGKIRRPHDHDAVR